MFVSQLSIYLNTRWARATEAKAEVSICLLLLAKTAI